MLRSPLAWTGGKSRLRGEIIRRIPAHTTYVEVFAGAAWVLFGKEPGTSKSEVLNDLDGELVNWWRVLKHRPAEFAERATLAMASRELWNEWARELRGSEISNLKSQIADEVDRAVRFYVVIKCGFGAQRMPTAFAAHAARRPSMHWVDVREEVGVILGRLRQVWIERLDWRECLAKYDSASTFFYLDPPYRCPGSKAYCHKFEDADHQALAKALMAIKGKWLLSYNDDPWLEALYRSAASRRRGGLGSGILNMGSGIQVERVSVTYTVAATAPQAVRELLIHNYALPPAKRQE
jgi:DNA adenine methylase